MARRPHDRGLVIHSSSTDVDISHPQPSVVVESCGKNYTVEILGPTGTKKLLFGHTAINPLKIKQVGEFNGDSPAFACHRYAHFGIEELSKQAF